jgi:hypothetical protein
MMAALLLLAQLACPGGLASGSFTFVSALVVFSFAVAGPSGDGVELGGVWDKCKTRRAPWCSPSVLLLCFVGKQGDDGWCDLQEAHRRPGISRLSL